MVKEEKKHEVENKTRPHGHKFSNILCVCGQYVRSSEAYDLLRSSMIIGALASIPIFSWFLLAFLLYIPFWPLRALGFWLLFETLWILASLVDKSRKDIAKRRGF